MRSLFCFGLAVLIVGVDSSALVAANDIRKVVFSGDVVPGAPGHTFIPAPDTFRLNDLGHLAFLGYIRNSASFNTTGIWIDGANGLVLVARYGDPAPGIATTFSAFRNGIALNNNDQISVGANFDPSSIDNTGIWSNSLGSLQLVTRQGLSLPGIPGRSIGPQTIHSLGDNGKTVFFTYLRGGGPTIATVWKGDANGISLLAQSDTQAPGTPAGSVFVARSGITTSANRRGDVVMGALLSGPAVTAANNGGLWTDRDGPFTLLVQNGDLLPEVTTGTTLTMSAVGFASINDDGKVAFGTTLVGTGVTTLNDTAIVLENRGVMSVIVRDGDVAPGIAAPTVFSDGQSFQLNNAGGFAVLAGLAGPDVTNANRVGLWTGTPGDFHLIMRQGDAAPGLPGVTFGNTLGMSSSKNILFNDLGQVAFAAQLIGSGVTPANDISIWATDVSGALHLIAREGDSIEFAPGDNRIISGLRDDTLPIPAFGFNNRGQLAFWARFNTGAGIFISNAVAVPEPSSVTLISGGVLILSMLMQNRRSSKALRGS